jgi:glycosyltransferase involved in cell wall biosynthesis
MVLKCHENVRLLIIGKIPDKILPKIKKLSCKNIHFAGFLKKEELEPMIFTSSILVNPRQSGVLADAGFPTKLGEYFATKRPVVATKVGDLAHYFSDKEEIVFAEPNNPKSLADAILFLLENKEKGDQIGLKGFDWALNNLDYIKNSRKLIEFLNCK